MPTLSDSFGCDVDEEPEVRMMVEVAEESVSSNRAVYLLRCRNILSKMGAPWHLEPSYSARDRHIISVDATYHFLASQQLHVARCISVAPV